MGGNPVRAPVEGGTPNGAAVIGVPGDTGGEPRPVIPVPIGLPALRNVGCCRPHGIPGHVGKPDIEPAKNGSVIGNLLSAYSGATTCVGLTGLHAGHPYTSYMKGLGCAPNPKWYGSDPVACGYPTPCPTVERAHGLATGCESAAPNPAKVGEWIVLNGCGPAWNGCWSNCCG